MKNLWRPLYRRLTTFQFVSRMQCGLNGYRISFNQPINHYSLTPYDVAENLTKGSFHWSRFSSLSWARLIDWKEWDIYHIRSSAVRRIVQYSDLSAMVVTNLLLSYKITTDRIRQERKVKKASTALFALHWLRGSNQSINRTSLVLIKYASKFAQKTYLSASFFTSHHFSWTQYRKFFNHTFVW